MYYHQPVMKELVLKYLNVATNKVYVDSTLGEGGHSEIILNYNNIKLLVGIEQDEELMNIAKKRLSTHKNFICLNGNFKDIDTLIDSIGIKRVDGILYDLGVSMYHLQKSEKGLSFKRDLPLDMDLSGASNKSIEIINKYSEKELADIIYRYGEERFSHRIARLIVKERDKGIIDTTGKLADIVKRAIPKKNWSRHLHPAARTFQALRIAVNDELSNLDKSLKKVPSILNKNGRIVVISYHSLEDRIVKYTFKYFEKEGIMKILTKKPLTASEDELKLNRSARSAKLRVAEML